MTPKQRIEKAVKLLETIVVPTGIDAGVILKSSESPTEVNVVNGYYLPTYKHECLSDLGDHLVALYHILTDTKPEDHNLDVEKLYEESTKMADEGLI